MGLLGQWSQRAACVKLKLGPVESLTCSLQGGEPPPAPWEYLLTQWGCLAKTACWPLGWTHQGVH